jgi:guanylate kinase
MGTLMDGVPRSSSFTILSGPSGVGKGAVVAATRLLAAQSGVPLWLSVSDTTRDPRKGEVDGESYNFIDEVMFDRRAGNGYYLEYARHMSASYGTPGVPVVQELNAGVNVLLEIDMVGAANAQKVACDIFELAPLRVFLAPPSIDQLKRQLLGRGTESANKVEERLQKAQIEMASEHECDAILVNRDIQSTARLLLAIITR